MGGSFIIIIIFLFLFFGMTNTKGRGAGEILGENEGWSGWREKERRD